MPSLRDMQQNFAEAILARTPPVLAPYIRGPHAEERSLIYVNTVYGTLGKALEAIYPVIARLLGARCLDGLVRNFIRKVPSRSGDLHNYGGEFADFLADTPLYIDYPYLPDVARLEWQMHRVFHACDSSPLDMQQLQSVDPENYSELRFTLAPASALMVSPYPVQLVWQANQAGQDGSVVMNTEEARLLLLRGRGAIEIIPLSSGEYALLEALHAGGSIAVSMDAALETGAEFDLQLILAREIARGTLAGFSICPYAQKAP